MFTLFDLHVKKQNKEKRSPRYCSLLCLFVVVFFFLFFFFFFIDFILYVPVNNVSVMLGRVFLG